MLSCKFSGEDTESCSKTYMQQNPKCVCWGVRVCDSTRHSSIIDGFNAEAVKRNY